MSRLPTLPDFDQTNPSMATVLRTVKLALEILGGMRQGESEGAPLIFVQGNLPRVAMDNARRKGDLWVDSDDDMMRYWDGKGWRGITGAGVARTFVQATAPGKPLRVGDQWINSSTNAMSYWNGSAWVAIA